MHALRAYKVVEYSQDIQPYDLYVLGADIGGTNTNFGIFRSTDDALELVVSMHYKSQEITDFVAVVQDMLSYMHTTYNINIHKGCFAVAGVISPDRDQVTPTNLKITLDAHAIMQNTTLTCVFFANDFEIIGHGIDAIAHTSLIKVNKGIPRARANRAVLGAGTGLGKSILVWNDQLNRYVPCASEGGHADFCAQVPFEFDLMQYIKTTEQKMCNVSWENVLSGNGIRRIYNFFKSRNPASSALSAPLPDEIFNSKDRDELCGKTFELYTQLYARCAKNLALDALALNGIYIAGGIATHNVSMFELPIFMQEFTNCGTQGTLLRHTPVYVITDYNISLYGAAHYMIVENVCK